MFSKIINSLEEAIIAILLASMTLLVFLEVTLRFGFNTGVMWAQELTLHLSCWMVMFGASYGIKIGSHIGVDALVRILSPTTRRMVTGVAVIACLLYCTLVGMGAWVYLEKVYSISIELEDMAIQKWVAHSIMLIGIVLMAWRLLELLWEVITGKSDSFKMIDEAKESMRLAEETKILMAAQAAKEGDSA
ncbi:MAG: TRAP transporter small permease subunit [Spirochaeta sp.]|nr:TRAP transporter small permease subunit [Spirochaeta sp.]